jgi:kynurenine formamidase
MSPRTEEVKKSRPTENTATAEEERGIIIIANTGNTENENEKCQSRDEEEKPGEESTFAAYLAKKEIPQRTLVLSQLGF